MTSLFDRKLRIYGYKGLDRSQLSKQNVIETMELIKGIELPDTSIITDASVSPRNIAKQSRKILTNLFLDLHRNVRVISISEMQKLTMLLNYNKISSDQFLAEVQKKSSLLDVSAVPIEFLNDSHCSNGVTVKPLPLFDDPIFLNRAPIVISAFKIGGQGLSRLGIITHLHEMTHALLERNKGSVRDYYKAEMLTILMEKIAADEIDKTSVLLSKQNIYRYENLKQNLQNKNDDECHKYLLSTLLAEVLFDKYVTGTEAYKDHLLAQITKVLNGELVLEDMLTSEGITLDNANLPCFIEENVQKSIRNLK